MMRTALRGVGVWAVFAVGAGAPAEDKKADGGKFDPAALVGKWTIASGVKSGQKADEKELAKTEVVFTKDEISLKSPEAAFKFKYKLDASADPVKIDLEMTESPFGAGMKAVGVVKVEKGRLHLAYDPMGEKRPGGFDGAKSYAFVLKKAVEKK